jgi:P27 family predicted phage terminase small subunit
MKTKAPNDLAPATKVWFSNVLLDFELEEHDVRLLTLAAQAWDRCQEARSELQKDGLTIESRQGIKPHPAIAIERDSANRFAALIKQLELGVNEPKRVGRPPTGYDTFAGRHNGQA